MATDFHLANFPPEFVNTYFDEYFQTYGQVIKVEVLYDKDQQPRNNCRLRLEIPPEQITLLLEEFNQSVWETGLRPLISPRKPFPLRGASPEEAKYAKEVALQLGETDRVPQNQIRRLLLNCGPAFVQRVLEDALEIEAAGGMLTQDKSRRRTLGGIFFHLLRYRLSPFMQYVVFPRPADKKPSPDHKKASPRPQSSSETPKPPAAPKGQSAQAKAKPTPQAPQHEPPAPKPKPAPALSPEILRPPAPVLDAATIAKLQSEYRALRQAYQTAQEHLEHLKTLSAQERKSGLFSATREVVNIQKQLAALLKQYPDLEQP